METFLAITNAIPIWLNLFAVLVTVATAVTAVTPSKVENKALQWVLNFLNILAGNVLRNRNADA